MQDAPSEAVGKIRPTRVGEPDALDVRSPFQRLGERVPEDVHGR